ncbi:MAG TPA: hypothetical protein DDX39_12155 [Bacteroidales bacterium]|nr:MAG: hypothetical protein A2W98_11560 [Bacteroidetes bacterium GWF2_33_38]OFY68989.1 MAG: hypothetical protein A2265_06055 [Bacteroidetes bacterium RIFOXYA12_FULL_33_9]HBF89385.1 hypothetical protein [Bacteroidales bacterium]
MENQINETLKTINEFIKLCKNIGAKAELLKIAKFFRTELVIIAKKRKTKSILRHITNFNHYTLLPASFLLMSSYGILSSLIYFLKTSDIFGTIALNLISIILSAFYTYCFYKATPKI